MIVKQEKNIAVIFAGGVGSRMRSKCLPKQFLLIHGKPIIIHTLEHFQNCEKIDGIVISCVKDYIIKMSELVNAYNIDKVKKIVEGGATGQLSIYNGLVAARDIAGVDGSIVLIHDGVRPLIDETVILNNIECVKAHGSCITAGIVKETIVEIADSGEVLNVPQRKNSRVAKAPQSFYLKDILSAHERAIKEQRLDFIDSCTMMKEYGYKLHMVDGPYDNIKITTPDDYYTMRAIFDARENAQIYVEDEQ